MSTPRAQLNAEETAAIDRVRRRVAAVGFFMVAVHGVIGLIGVAHVVEGQGRSDDAVVLLVMSAFVAQVMVAVMRLILAHRPVAPLWVLIALLPTVAGWFWVF
ncbi:hypothetical protein ASD11_09455 [Aeromicrobium sp. Root495]|uniref:hypothetical protein n=1 Tax=Aeromicrobium sp. Root495 TaxID=1736550 RepID=UPI0006FF7C34|nr:hypothetical protein [Aeromicrobium sp. Root495]KQY59754.1 hypothetical protein ASD11_09455 [Aeromicrobium sp. Root495]